MIRFFLVKTWFKINRYVQLRAEYENLKLNEIPFCRKENSFPHQIRTTNSVCTYCVSRDHGKEYK